MKFQKNNPNLPEYSSQLHILNEFIDFISNLNTKKSLKFKQDAIKVVECLKFIKVNLDFIGYAVENKKDDRIYTYFTDKKKDYCETLTIRQCILIPTILLYPLKLH